MSGILGVGSRSGVIGETEIDYEEGTFTPTILAGGGSLGSCSTAVGYYTKIGDRVFFNLYLAALTKNSATGAITIEGLPFTASTYSSFSSWHFDGVRAVNSLIIRNNTGATSLQIQETTEAGVGGSLTEADIEVSTDLNWMVSGNYQH